MDLKSQNTPLRSNMNYIRDRDTLASAINSSNLSRFDLPSLEVSKDLLAYSFELAKGPVIIEFKRGVKAAGKKFIWGDNVQEAYYEMLKKGVETSVYGKYHEIREIIEEPNRALSIYRAAKVFNKNTTHTFQTLENEAVLTVTISKPNIYFRLDDKLARFETCGQVWVNDTNRR